MSSTRASTANRADAPLSPDFLSGHTDEIDLRPMDRRERLPLLELSLSVLQPGDVLHLVWEDRPTRLERHLQTHYGDRLVWWPVDAGDDWFILGVRCLAPIAAPA